MNKPNVYDCSLVELPKIANRAGNITPVHGNVNVPFDVKRVFYTYDIPGGEARGAHAHKECHQFLVAASGSFEVVLDDGVNKRTVLLNRPFYGLHIPPGISAYPARDMGRGAGVFVGGYMPCLGIACIR